MNNKEKKPPLTVEEFEALPTEKKRVLVAKDVLAAIAAERYVPRMGAYIKLGKYGLGEYGEDPELRRLGVREHLDKLVRCHVCALGACLLSTTRFRNRLIFDNLVGLTSDDKEFDLLEGIFTGKELLLMESCFEGVAGWGFCRVGRDRFEENLDEEEEEVCRAVFKAINNAPKCLTFLMETIIYLKGKPLTWKSLSNALKRLTSLNGTASSSTI